MTLAVCRSGVEPQIFEADVTSRTGGANRTDSVYRAENCDSKPIRRLRFIYWQPILRTMDIA